MKLVITVDEIRGRCPVYKEGDRIVLDGGYKMNLEATDAVCMHSLASIMPYHIALSRGVSAKSCGLNPKADSPAYVQCLDPVHRTQGGTVTFRIELEGPPKPGGPPAQ
jgi:uncharacterized repeat protein (TIGR04076 family)